MNRILKHRLDPSDEFEGSFSISPASSSGRRVRGVIIFVVENAIIRKKRNYFHTFRRKMKYTAYATDLAQLTHQAYVDNPNANAVVLYARVGESYATGDTDISSVPSEMLAIRDLQSTLHWVNSNIPEDVDKIIVCDAAFIPKLGLNPDQDYPIFRVDCGSSNKDSTALDAKRFFVFLKNIGW